MFNEYGNIIKLPEDLQKAKCDYFKVVEKHLDKMPILEVRAFLWYINLDTDVAEYILKRQLFAGRKAAREYWEKE